jgi:hypothetical protein
LQAFPPQAQIIARHGSPLSVWLNPNNTLFIEFTFKHVFLILFKFISGN